jgi:hypothetical protein
VLISDPEERRKMLFEVSRDYHRSSILLTDRLDQQDKTKILSEFGLMSRKEQARWCRMLIGVYRAASQRAFRAGDVQECDRYMEQVFAYYQQYLICSGFGEPTQQ